MYLSERKAAEFLDLAPSTLRTLRCRGAATMERKSGLRAALKPIPYHQFGRAVRYKLSDLESYAEGFRVEPGEQVAR